MTLRQVRLRKQAQRTEEWERTVAQFFDDYIGIGQPGYAHQKYLLKSLANDLSYMRRRAYQDGWKRRDRSLAFPQEYE